MINIPKTMCSPCEIPIIQELITLPPILDDCDCPENKQTILLDTAIDSNQFCPICPVFSVTTRINVNPKPTYSIQSDVCFDNFIKNITSTKLCISGPQCK